MRPLNNFNNNNNNNNNPIQHFQGPLPALVIFYIPNTCAHLSFQNLHVKPIDPPSWIADLCTSLHTSMPCGSWPNQFPTSQRESISSFWYWTIHCVDSICIMRLDYRIYWGKHLVYMTQERNQRRMICLRRDWEAKDRYNWKDDARNPWFNQYWKYWNHRKRKNGVWTGDEIRGDKVKNDKDTVQVWSRHHLIGWIWEFAANSIVYRA